MEYIGKGAKISQCGRYRYKLWREWRGTHDSKNWRWLEAKDGAGSPLGESKACVFIMLNPSTADAEQDDPTIRRCVGFAKAWNYERLEVVNLFAYRATQPAVILAMDGAVDPIGPDNLEWVTGAVANAGIIICAWGAHGSYLRHDETVLGWCGTKAVHALGLTVDGSPRHPLYLPSSSKPTLFNGRRMSC
jgi:hypothetical protein